MIIWMNWKMDWQIKGLIKDKRNMQKARAGIKKLVNEQNSKRRLKEGKTKDYSDKENTWTRRSNEYQQTRDWMVSQRKNE